MHEQVAHAFPPRHLHQRREVRVLAVDAAVGDQAQQVQRSGARRVHRASQHLVMEERARFDRPVDADQVLVDDASGAQVGVPDLAVPHLSFGEPDGQAAGLELRDREMRGELVDVRGALQQDGVSLATGGVAPSVEDDQQHGPHALLW